MAGSELTPTPGTFALPTLEQYQLAQRAAVANKNKNSTPGDGWSRLVQGGVFDLTRGPMGYKSAQERQVSNASAVAQDAVQKAAKLSTDPLEQRRIALTDMVQRFNSLGYTDLVAQAMPELAGLEQRLEEMRKLTAEADSSQSKARVDKATEAANIENENLAPDATRASTAKDKATTAKTNVDAALARNEGVNMQSPDGKTRLNVGKLSTETRNALRSQGWVEIGLNVDVDDPSKLGKKEGEELRATAGDTANLINSLGDIKQLAISQPGAWSVGGAIASKVAGIAEQVKASMKQAGMSEKDYETAITTTREGSSTGTLLDRANIADARQRAMVLNLAYVRAKALDPGGRLSNQDVEIARQIVQGSNPQQQLALLEDILTSASRSFDTRAAIMGNPMDSNERKAVRDALDRYASIKPPSDSAGGTTTPSGRTFREVTP